MSEELSNVTKILVGRMETNPEDFDMRGEYPPKFQWLADYLTKLAGGGDALRHHNPNSYIEEPFWFLSDADKAALVNAWKQYHYRQFEKNIMDKLFDDGYEARMRDEMMRKAWTAGLGKQGSPYQAIQRDMAVYTQSTGTGPVTDSGGFLSGLFK